MDAQPPTSAPVPAILADSLERCNGDLVDRQTLKLIRHAIRQKWPVPKELRQQIMTRAQELLGRAALDVNEFASIAKVVIAADTLNARREAEALAASKKEKGSGTTIHGNVNILSVEQLKRLPADELIRLHRETLNLPLSLPDPPGAGA